MNSQEQLDQVFLEQTLTLARKGLSFTLPNPMVGAVIVKNGKIIAKGFHKKIGLPHAEIEALKKIKVNQTVGATLYVNLEPCSHFGKTPPCTDEIIKSGISRVVCSTLDPNPKVSGKGISALKKAGIEVSMGLLKENAEKLNEAFFIFHKKNRPFIALKFASSLDGKIATYSFDSKGITGKKAVEYSYSIRSKYQSILVGVNTVLFDNPNLGSHSKTTKDPLRIILDSKLQIPLESQILRDRNVLIAATESADPAKRERFKKLGIEVLIFKGGRIPLDELLKALTEKEIISVLVEGGGEVLGSFIDENLFDKLYAFYSPIIIGGKNAITTVGGKGVNLISQAKKFQIESLKKFNEDFLLIANPK